MSFVQHTANITFGFRPIGTGREANAECLFDQTSIAYWFQIFVCASLHTQGSPVVRRLRIKNKYLAHRPEIPARKPDPDRTRFMNRTNALLCERCLNRYFMQMGCNNFCIRWTLALMHAIWMRRLVVCVSSIIFRWWIAHWKSERYHSWPCIFLAPLTAATDCTRRRAAVKVPHFPSR